MIYWDDQYGGYVTVEKPKEIAKMTKNHRWETNAAPEPVNTHSKIPPVVPKPTTRRSQSPQYNVPPSSKLKLNRPQTPHSSLWDWESEDDEEITEVEEEVIAKKTASL